MKFAPEIQRNTASNAGEMLNTPTLMKCIHHISNNSFVAFKAYITKQLIIMSLTVCQALPFIITMTIKWLFTFGAHKMLNMPSLSKGMNHTFFNRPPTSSTNWCSHFIMASQAIQLSVPLTAEMVQLLVA